MDILLRPRIQFKAIEGDALDADADLGQPRADVAIEAIAVHSEVAGRVAEAEEAGEHGGRALCDVAGHRAERCAGCQLEMEVRKPPKRRTTADEVF